MEVNGESSFFFRLCKIKTKIAQDYSTALKASLDVLKYDWLQKLVEPRPSENFVSNEPWDLGDLWEPVLYWYKWKLNYIYQKLQLWRKEQSNKL